MRINRIRDTKNQCNVNEIIISELESTISKHSDNDEEKEKEEFEDRSGLESIIS